MPSIAVTRGIGMDKERWHRVGQLFHAALELSPDRRHAYLAGAAPDDEAMRDEVLSLLAAASASENFLESPVVDAGLDLLAVEEGAAWEGQVLGAYRLISKLGEGGMGSVYLAERADEAYQQKVAIKLLKPGMVRQDLVRGFVTERQMLANLVHPNIARLLDGGMTTGGLPYLVLEYIEGLPIDRFCADSALKLRDKLGLFLKVCAAVEFAHSSFVAHRDLKPSNILVTKSGDPKLLDFGVARLLDAESGALARDFTITDLRAMTPAYASPEQVRGGPISRTTDVYSLGVLLFELLTGQRPYRLTDHSPREIERIVCECESPRPSTVVDRAPHPLPDRFGFWGRSSRGAELPLSRQLRGDLDNIVLKALRKAPDRRYDSVEGLASDLDPGRDRRHHMAGENCSEAERHGCEGRKHYHL